MAVLYITEYQEMAQIPNSAAIIPQEPPLAEQIIALNIATVTLSRPFNPKTSFIRLLTDTACIVEIGFPPFANVGSWRMAVDMEVLRGVPVGQGVQIAAIMLLGAASQPLFTSDISSYDSQMVVELLGSILQELRVANFMRFTQSAMNDASPLDDPATLRNDSSVFN
jgi:hypothetical protein